MSNRVTSQIIRTNLLEHRAVKAWSELRPARVEPTSIHVLREREKAAIYRLTGVGSGGSDVIAKWCLVATAWIERTIYEEVLPHLPVTAPHYYGAREGDGESCWLFLEDVGGERYSALNEEHRALAGRWLGLMHASAARIPAAARLPDGGPGRYLGHLRSSRRTILRNLTNPPLTAEDRAVLKKIVAQHDFLESCWSHVEKSCEGVPSTLVHGDFRPKNAHIRIDHTGISLFPIDWETAGWGAAAADLTRVDIAAYWSIVREYWPNVDMQAIQRLAAIGQLFRWLVAISWESPNLAFEVVKLVLEPMACMRIYQARLSDAMQAAGLAQ